METRMEPWTQLLFDWEAAERDERLLETQLKINGLSEAERWLVHAIGRDGEEVQHEGLRIRSRLEATMRRMAALAGCSLSAASKGKTRLVGRGLLRYGRGLWELSWIRIWALGNPPATPSPHHPPTPSPPHPPAGAEMFPRVSARFRAFPRPQEQDTYLHPPDPKPNQDQEIPIGAVFQEAQTAGGVQAAVMRMHQRQLDALAEGLIQRIGPIEERHQVAADDRLALTTARRIARGILADPDSDSQDQLDGVFGYLERQPCFARSPAAALVRCCQRRRWYPQAPTAEGRADGAGA